MKELLQEEPPGNLTILMSKHVNQQQPVGTLLVLEKFTVKLYRAENRPYTVIRCLYIFDGFNVL